MQIARLVCDFEECHSENDVETVKFTHNGVNLAIDLCRADRELHWTSLLRSARRDGLRAVEKPARAPYVCQMPVDGEPCGFSGTRDVFRAHAHTEHNTSVAVATGRRAKVKCETCGRTFAARNFAASHAWRSHHQGNDVVVQL